MGTATQATPLNDPFNKNIRISIKILLKYAPKGLADNESAMVQVMTPHLTMTRSSICVTQLHWVNKASKS